MHSSAAPLSLCAIRSYRRAVVIVDLKLGRMEFGMVVVAQDTVVVGVAKHGSWFWLPPRHTLRLVGSDEPSPPGPREIRRARLTGADISTAF